MHLHRNLRTLMPEEVFPVNAHGKMFKAVMFNRNWKSRAN
jgi:hypothetical protein